MGTVAGEKWYVVRLTDEEREYLRDLVRTGRIAGYKRTHAQILLRCDQGGRRRGWSDQRVAAALDVSAGTVRNVRKRLVEQGLHAALGRKKQEKPSRPRKLDGRAEAHLIAVSCSPPPEGRAKWTMRLLGDQLVQLDIVESISDETVRRALKKTRSSRT